MAVLQSTGNEVIDMWVKPSTHTHVDLIKKHRLWVEYCPPQYRKYENDCADTRVRLYIFMPSHRRQPWLEAIVLLTSWSSRWWHQRDGHQGYFFSLYKWLQELQRSQFYTEYKSLRLITFSSCELKTPSTPWQVYLSSPRAKSTASELFSFSCSLFPFALVVHPS